MMADTPALPDWLPEGLVPHMQVWNLEKGHALFQTGDAVDHFHFVLSGELAAIRCTPGGAEAVMLTARSGEFFAEASLFLPRYTCEARAFADSRVAGWPAQTFRAALATHPEAALSFARTLAISLRRQCSRVERLRLKHAPDRVMHYQGCETGPDGWAYLPGNVQEWASELGLEPETLYRVLAQLGKSGQIEREKHRLRLVGATGLMCTR